MRKNRFPFPISILLAAAAAVALGALYFAPWLTLSAEPQEQMKSGIYHFAPTVPREIREELTREAECWPFAHANAMHLAKGRLKAYRDAEGVPAIQEGFPYRRKWVLFCAVLPGVFLLACAATAARLVSRSRTGGYLLLGGLTGVVLMLAASSVDFYEDLRRRVEREGNTRYVRDDSRLAALTGTFQSMQVLGGKETFKTHPTKYFWVSLGLYGLVTLCGLAARAPDGLSSERRPVIREEGPLLRHRMAFAARQPGPPHAGPSPPPDFGPNVDDDSPETNRRSPDRSDARPSGRSGPAQ